MPPQFNANGAQSQPIILAVQQSLPLATERHAAQRPVIGPQARPELSPEEATRLDEEQMLAQINAIHADVDTLIPRVRVQDSEV